MARKRKGLQALDYQSNEYWQKLLAKEGLSMRRGEHPKLSYQGTTNDIEYIEGQRYANTGAVKVKPEAE